MTTVAYPLGAPPAADMRGGDCRARDLNQARNDHGPHRFAATTHCRINNGLLRLTVGATGAVPSLTVEARRGRVVIEDYISDVVSDTIPGAIATPAWFPLGTLTIDSPSVSALLTAVQLPKVSPGEGRAKGVTLRLMVPAINDVYVVLHRGERHIHIHHGQDGSRNGPTIDIDRRIRWTASPSPVGTAFANRVEEMAPALDSFPRWVASNDPVTTNAGSFSLTAASVTTARFGAGVGTWATQDRPSQQHWQLGDASRPSLVVT